MTDRRIVKPVVPTFLEEYEPAKIPPLEPGKDYDLSKFLETAGPLISMFLPLVAGGGTPAAIAAAIAALQNLTKDQGEVTKE